MRRSPLAATSTSPRCSRGCGVAPRRITADSRAGRARRRVRRVSGRTRRRPRVHRRRDRARRGAVLWDAAGSTWDPRWTVPNVAGRGPAARLGADRRLHLRQPVARRCGWSASPAPTARPRARTGSRMRSTALRPPRRRASARSATASPGALAPAANTTPDAALLQEPLAQFRRGRRDGGGDGGLVARARPGPRERRRVRRRAVHQPDARPPRLPRHDGRLRRGEGEAVRLAGTRAPR